uniref:Uncharacterized protein n=2 Tax=Avena sativa TaxID=4498 RepID=A0ACD5VJP5_AVESA
MIKASKFHFFSLLPGQGEGCVLFANPSANVSVYDVDLQSVVAMPPASFPKPTNSIVLSITNQRPGSSTEWSPKGEYDLYVMSTHDGSFEFFNYCRTSMSAYPNDWYWRRLPHVPPCGPDSYYTVRPDSPPFAAAVVDNSTICASSNGGTYAFDISRGVWRQLAGAWTLPFHGAAEYVPKFRLWFGLEAPNGSSQHRLCAFDLASAPTAEEAPASQHSWDYLEGLPDEWYPSVRRLVNLGLGKFCIATCFLHRPSPEEGHMEVVGDEVTVLTGVEVVREGNNGLHMIKHKSLHYKLDNMGIQCVL